MCECQVNPSEVWGVYEEGVWESVEVYWMYASEFEMNNANASLSKASASLSKAIWCEWSTILQRDKGSNELVFLK